MEGKDEGKNERVEKGRKEREKGERKKTNAESVKLLKLLHVTKNGITNS